MITNMSQIGDVLFFEIMSESAVNDIAPMTKAFLLQQTLDANSNLAVRRYKNASIAARNEHDDDGDEDGDFVARHDAVLAGITDYLNAISMVEA
ncbi:MAG: hypothetical protein JWP25_6541 [Bradyrhizobium sp.]|nr:hypothetical protein [Bradyrhizobium sp.]